MSFSFHVPTNLVFGQGAIQKLHKQRLPGKHALIVISSGKSTRANGYLDIVQDQLTQAGVTYTVFDKILANPVLDNVMDGAACARANGCDFVLGLGGGSSIDAAKAIRERDKTGTVVMISNESCASYNRPMLTKTMLASLTAEQIAVEPESWYEENDICQILGRTVVSVDTEKSEVILDDGSQIHFTRLIYALGSECFIPPIPGSGRKQVIAVRRISDVEKISGLLKRSKNAVVIGGGVLGLEAAWELKKAGLSVTVLEAAPMLMGRQLDATAGSKSAGKTALPSIPVSPSLLSTETSQAL